MRSKAVTVARIVKSPLQGLKEEAESLDQILSFLQQVRDGDGRLDTFYLGEIEAGSTDRYSAKFDQLYTIQIPIDETDRITFLQERRHLSLDPAFSHDLHQRLYRAFASLGFDDDAWFTDADLNLVVEYGRSQRAVLEGRIAEMKSRLGVVSASGGNKKEEKNLNTDLKAPESGLKQLNEKLSPFEAELARRGSARD